MWSVALAAFFVLLGSKIGVKKMLENLEVTNIIFITHLAIIRLTNLSESEKNWFFR